MSNRREFIKKSLAGTAGVAVTTFAAGKPLIAGIIDQTEAIEPPAGWGYRIGQRNIPRVMIKSNPADFKVYPNHPRLYFRDTDLVTIRKRIGNELKPEWEEMLSDMDNRVLKTQASSFAEGKYLKGWATGRNAAFVAAITGEQKYVTWAKQWAEALAAAGPVGNDDQYRGRLQSLAVAYDWLYSWLSAEEKQRILNAILEHIGTY